MERDALRRVSRAFLQAAEKGNGAAVLAADKQFRNLFATCAHKNFAATVMEPLDSLSGRFFYVHKLIVGDIQLSAKLHANLVLAITDGDPQGAEDAADAMADYLDEFACSTLDQPLALLPRTAPI